MSAKNFIFLILILCQKELLLAERNKWLYLDEKKESKYHVLINDNKYLSLGKGIISLNISTGTFIQNKKNLGGGVYSNLNYKNFVSFYDLKLVSYYNDDDKYRKNPYISLAFRMSNRIPEKPSFYIWSQYKMKKDKVNLIKSSFTVETGFGWFFFHLKTKLFKIRQNIEIGPLYRYESLEDFNKQVSTNSFNISTESDFLLKKFSGKTRFSYLLKLNSIAKKDSQKSQPPTGEGSEFIIDSELYYKIKNTYSVYSKIQYTEILNPQKKQVRTYFFFGAVANIL